MQIKTLMFILCLALILGISTSYFKTVVSKKVQILEKTDSTYNIEMLTLNGKKISINDHIGKKPVYIKFWASWCQPCRQQMPHFQETFNKHNSDIAMIAINIGINDSLKEIKKTQSEFSLEMPIAIDHSGKLSQAFNMPGTPYHVILDIAGNTVFKGHEASPQLDKTLKLLSNSATRALPNIPATPLRKSSFIDTSGKTITALFFTSTWCDWYLEETRPAASKNCIAGQRHANSLHVDHSQFNWIGVTSRLWTGAKELNQYIEKYQIKYPHIIDINEQEFIKYNVKKFPTLILVQDGKEVFRTSDFNNLRELSYTINSI